MNEYYGTEEATDRETDTGNEDIETPEDVTGLVEQQEREANVAPGQGELGQVTGEKKS